MMRCRIGIAALAGVVGLAAGIAEAGPIFGFTRMTANNVENVAAQMSFEVNDGGSVGMTNYVDFTFRNSGPIDSVIHRIWFEDGTLLGLADTNYNNDTGVAFSPDPSPNNPQGAVGPFSASQAFSADADNPGPQNGINEGEQVTFRYSLLAGRTYADTIQALMEGLDGRDALGGGLFSSLRIAIHVTGIGIAGDSDAFLYDGPPGDGHSIPLPSAAAMGMVGLVVVARRRRRLA